MKSLLANLTSSTIERVSKNYIGKARYSPEGECTFPARDIPVDDAIKKRGIFLPFLGKLMCGLETVLG